MKTRDRLENMLVAKGLIVQNLCGVQGQWRKAIMDVMRWDANCTQANGARVHIGSWDTMTECVRRGFKLVQENEAYEMEAVANEKTKGL